MLKKSKRLIALILALTMSFMLSIQVFAKDNNTYEKFLEIIEKYKQYYIEDAETEQMLLDMVKWIIENEPEAFEFLVWSLLQGGNKFNYYFNSEEFEAEMTKTSSEGVGMHLDIADEFVKVIYVSQNTPASRAGVKAGDILYSFAGKKLSDLEDPLTYISEYDDRRVEFTVYRPSEARFITYNLERLPYTEQTVFYDKYKSGNNSYAVIKITGFDGESTSEEFFNAMYDIYMSGIKRLVIDLRDNPGGYLENALTMINSLTSKKGMKIVDLDFKGNKNDMPLETTGEGLDFDKIAVILNERSASASELLAVSLQENNLAKVFGTQSYGKGVGQQIIELSDGSAIYIVTLELITPKGNRYNGKGITPDVVVENPKAELPNISFKPFNHDNYINAVYGETNETVYALEQRLNLLGLLDIVDETFGDDTTEALKVLQKRNGLEVTGVLDLVTFELITDMVNIAKKLPLPVNDEQLNAAINYVTQ